MKSLFDELDHPNPDTYRSNPNAPESTATQCLAGCQESLEVAVYQRRLVHEAFARWIDAYPGSLAQSKLMLKEFEAQRRKRKDFTAAELERFDEYMVLRGDRLRSESEVKHWRELIDWWRARDALGWDRTYGKSSSARDLIRQLADSKATP